MIRILTTVMVAIVLAGYLVGSFVYWSFDPSTWGLENRAGIIAATLCCVAGGWFIVVLARCPPPGCGK